MPSRNTLLWEKLFREGERERERVRINLERGTKVGVRYEYGTLTVIYCYFTVLNNTKFERYNRENKRDEICMISFIRER